ncbi:MAG: hypothetical protein ACOC9T_03255, partial [Myxococcota bacterium]
MPRGIPSSKGFSDIVALDVPRLTNVPLVKAAAFRANQKRKDDRTGREYEVEQIKLSLDFDSGHIMRDSDGNPVLDEDGNEQPHYIHEGYTTLSGNPRAKFVAIVKALGFTSKEFIEQQGRGKGGLTAEAAESLEVQFGTNALGEDYSGQSWEDLPLYIPGGDLRKRQVEVPILSMKILGYEVLGRWCDMALTTDDKGFNRVDTYMVSEKPAPLTKDAPPATSIPKQTSHATSKPLGDETEGEDTPLDPEPERPARTAPPWEGKDPSEMTPEEKGRAYVLNRLQEANVPPPFHAAVARLVSGFDDFDRIEDMPTAACRNFRDMHKADEDGTLIRLGEVARVAVEGADVGVLA